MTLRPSKPAPEVTPHFVTLDIENDPDGKVLAIGVSWRAAPGESGLRHATFPGWAEWWEWHLVMRESTPGFDTLFAHNGCGWDWLSLARWLIVERPGLADSLSGVMAGSRLVVLMVQLPGGKRIRLCDSLHLLRSGLDALSRQFLGAGKADTGGDLPHVLLAKNPAKFWEYLRRDCDSLLLVLESFFSLLRERVAKIDSLGVTIASTAMKVYRCGYSPEGGIDVPINPYLKGFLREGYRGGRVEVFQAGYHKRVRVYDINSLYPACMYGADLPVSAAGYWTQELTPEDSPGCAMYRVRFHQANRVALPVLCIGGEGAYEGAGVFCSPELALLRRIDPRATIGVEEGFIFTETVPIFRSFVGSLWAMRKDDPASPLGVICKWLMNNLYGKFGQRPEREKIVHVSSFEKLYDMVGRDGAKVTPINSELGMYQLTEETPISFEHVGIAAMITSQARVRLYEGFNRAGFQNVVYCDTDSVHSLSDMPVGVGLGEFKEEFRGEGVYLAKKTYGLRGAGMGEKIRAKGVRVHDPGKPFLPGSLGAKLNFAKLVRMLDGEPLACTFRTSATPRETLNGAVPCHFKATKTRRIRRERKRGFSSAGTGCE